MNALAHMEFLLACKVELTMDRLPVVTGASAVVLVGRKTVPRDPNHCHCLGGPSKGVHADLVTSEICQCKEVSAICFSVKCLLISVSCMLIVC